MSLKQRCPICSKRNSSELNRRNIDEIINYINTNKNDYIVDLSNYKNNKTKLKIIHKICGEEFYSNINNFIGKDSKCPKCAYKNRANKTRLDYNIIKNKIREITNGEYELVSKNYINNCTPIDIIHNECGRILKVSYSNFISNGVRCSCKSESKGELEVERILNIFNIEYIPQYKFYNCKNKRSLPFDFYLPKYNTCIEYQGRQHYESVEIFGGEKQLLIQKNNDNIKREYCKNNNIKLVEIPYWDFNNIEKYIKNIISKV